LPNNSNLIHKKPIKNLRKRSKIGVDLGALPRSLWLLMTLMLLLRIPMVMEDLPPFQFCDEVMFHGEVSRMIQSSDLLPLEFRAGGFNIYPAYLLFNLINFFLPAPLNFTQMLIIGRLLYVVAIPTILLIFVFKLSTLFASERTAVITSILYGFSLFNLSNYWYPDTYVQFGVLGFLYFLLKIFLSENSKRENFLFCGIFLAISISTKYTTLLLFLTLAYFLSLRIFSKSLNKIAKGDLTSLIMAFVITLVVLNPGMILRYGSFKDGFIFNLKNYGDYPGIRWDGYGYYFGILIANSFGILGFISLVLGVCLSHKKLILVFGLWIYPFALILSLGDKQWVVGRNMASAVPFLLPFITIGIGYLYSNLKSFHFPLKIVSGFSLFTIIPTLIIFLNLSAVSFKIDNRTAASKWLGSNLTREVKIGNNEFCSGDSPAIVAGNPTEVDPNFGLELDYYVINSYWPNPFSKNYLEKGVLTLGDQSKIHFEQWNSTKLFGSIHNREISQNEIPKGYILVKTFKGNGPDIFIFKKLSK